MCCIVPSNAVVPGDTGTVPKNAAVPSCVVVPRRATDTGDGRSRSNDAATNAAPKIACERSECRHDQTDNRHLNVPLV